MGAFTFVIIVDKETKKTRILKTSLFPQGTQVNRFIDSYRLTMANHGGIIPENLIRKGDGKMGNRITLQEKVNSIKYKYRKKLSEEAKNIDDASKLAVRIAKVVRDAVPEGIKVCVNQTDARIDGILVSVFEVTAELEEFHKEICFWYVPKNKEKPPKQLTDEEILQKLEAALDLIYEELR